MMLLCGAVTAFSGEGENFLNLWNVLGYGSLAFCILIIVIVSYNKKMSDSTKKIVYYLVIAVTGFVTLYLLITTLHLNINSETKGPVHWHADFEIFICDDKIDIADPQGLSNKVGTSLLHEHNDNRIHVEGVVIHKKDISLGAFFFAIEGQISNDELKVPTNSGIIGAHNGDKCNGNPATLYTFVNGELINNPSDYVISSYEKIPPGDRIKIVFTEKPLQSINKNIG